MGSKRREEFDRILACRAALLRRAGLTSREIATHLEIRVESVKGRVTLGERLLDTDKYKHMGETK
jgi:DNA-binding CsgD family transcriptional regulator